MKKVKCIFQWIVIFNLTIVIKKAICIFQWIAILTQVHVVVHQIALS